MRRFCQLLGSRKLTLLCMACGAAAMAFITFVEAVENTGEVPFPLYLSWWFTGLLALLWVNLLCNFAYPSWWRVRKLPLFLVHVGILTILCGGFLTWKCAIRGYLPLREGQRRDSFQPNQPVFSITDRAAGGTQSFVLITRRGSFYPQSLWDALWPFGSRSYPLPGGRAVEILRALPSGRIRKDLEEDPSGKGLPGVVLRVDSRRFVALQDGESIDWEKERSVTLKYFHQHEAIPEKETLKKVFGEWIEIVPAEGNALAVAVSLPGDVGRTFQKGPYTLHVDQYWPDFKVGRDPQPGDEPRNPAVRVTVTRGDWSRSVYAFALYQGHSNTLPDGASVNYSRPREGEILAVISDPEGGVSLYTKPTGEPLPLERGRSFRVGVGTHLLRFQLEAFYRSSRVAMRAEEDHTGKAPPAFQVRIAPDGEAVWISQGRGEATSGDGAVALSVADSYPLGFSLALRDAVALYWPASEIPRAFYSEVEVKAPGSEGFSARIETNAPLFYQGYELYQSSMDREPPYRWSGFQVAWDPGEIVAEVGFYLLMAGLAWLFATRYIVAPLRRVKAEGAREEV